jgi:hypothetical protein
MKILKGKGIIIETKKGVFKKMKTVLKKSLCFLIVLFILFSFDCYADKTLAATQTGAEKWFDKAYNTNSNTLKIEYYSKAIELNPNYFDAYYKRAEVYRYSNQYQKAIYDYSKAIELDPNYIGVSNFAIKPLVNVYINRGLTYIKLGQHQKAINDFNKVIELDPNSISAYYANDYRKLALGKIKITSNPPSVFIFLEDKPQGQTPKTLKNISPGNYQLRLIENGYQDYRQKVTVASGETTEVHAKLTKLSPSSGKVKVTSNPSSAKVFLGAEIYQGTTPLTLEDISPGKHMVTLVLDDYEKYVEEVEVVANRVVGVSATLTSTKPKPPSGGDNVKESQKIKESEEEKSSNIILDFERGSTADVLYLRNGDVITGTILNKNYNITTSYTQTQINNKMIKEIYLESGENNMSKILTINNNKISGFISNPIIVFKLKNGNQIEIRREKILKLVFRIDNEELQRISQSQSQFLILKNGDYFSGNILEKEFCIKTTYADIYCKLDEIKLITQIRGENPLTKVEMINGDLIQGILKTENINILLDIGPEVRIFQDHIDLIYCQEGFIPYEKLKLINITSDNENKFLKRNNGLEILELAENCSLRELGIKKGDVLTNINGKKINSIEVLDFVLKEIVLGKREKAIIEIVRNNKEIFLDLFKLFE